MAETVIVEKPKKSKVKVKQTPPDGSPPKKGRAKKQPPTKEELIRNIDFSISQIDKIICDLKIEQTKLSGLSLTNVDMLVKETIKNLEEDLEDIKGEKEEMMNTKE